jgi:two-component system, sensor histidine kinase PdtaS
MGQIGEVMKRVPLLADQRPLAYAITLAVSALAALVRLVLDPVFPPGYPYLTFFPAVIVTSFLFGRGPGTLAAVTCGLLAWYLFIPPPNGFAMNGPVAVALLFYVGVVTVDIALIHWMQRANRQLAAERERSRQLAERTELLFRELQHRVSNNLQMVGAVLNLQRRKVEDPAAIQALTDASSRLQMIGRIQRQLYDTSGAPVALDVFVRELATDLVAASDKPQIRCSVDAEPGILLSPDAAIPVALIVAESVSNAIEHGFDAEAAGRIGVAVRRDGDAILLEVRDDGRGLPAGFDLARTDSLGIKIARTLARQLEATFTLDPATGGGTVMRLALPGERTLLRLG